MNKGSSDLVGFQCWVWVWVTLFLFTTALAVWHRDIAMTQLDRATAIFLAVFGIHLVRILKAQHKRINSLEDELLRLTTRSPFAHASPMTNDQ